MWSVFRNASLASESQNIFRLRGLRFSNAQFRRVGGVVREYEGTQTAEAYNLQRPPYPTKVAEEILKYMNEHDPPERKRKRMIDVGCGGGQSTRIFSPYFESILGIDISQAQIEVAKKCVEDENIKFRLVYDNIFPVESNSMDLVTCGMAVHFLDLDLFFRECARVLKPGGCTALFLYIPKVLKSIEGKVIDSFAEGSALKSLTVEFAKDCGAHDGNLIYLDRYQSVFDRIRNPTKKWINAVEVTRIFTLSELLNLNSTAGGYKRENFVGKDPLDGLRDGMKKLLRMTGVPDDEIKLSVTIEYPIIVFRK